MPQYRHPEAVGKLDEVTVIEDCRMFFEDEGVPRPSYAFIDARTVRAHPLIVDALIVDAERVWSLEEMLRDLA